jgi:hypothetical protein
MCWIHKWEMWQTIETGKVKDILKFINGKTLTQNEGRYDIQRRTCRLCGKTQLREVRS